MLSYIGEFVGIPQGLSQIMQKSTFLHIFCIFVCYGNQKDSI
jgi:hypothetical protein